MSRTAPPQDDNDEYGDVVFDAQCAMHKLHVEIYKMLDEMWSDLCIKRVLENIDRLPTLEVLHYEISKTHAWLKNLEKPGE